jgi:hypothetical protein
LWKKSFLHLILDGAAVHRWDNCLVCRVGFSRLRARLRCGTCFFQGRLGVTLRNMNTANQPNVKFVQTPDYRDSYSNSVQIRVNVWDFFLVFGTMQQSSETQVELRNFQGIYLSPQQAKALHALLQQNVSNYEAAFGEIKLDPRAPGGPVH